MAQLTAITVSAFLCLAATPALAAKTYLSDAELHYYNLSFAYAMDTLQPGATYDWESHSIKGKITSSEPFKSKSGAYCRPFSETYAMGSDVGGGEGVACKRTHSSGWCKLDPKRDALTCAMEKSGRGFALSLPGFSSKRIALPAIGMEGPRGPRMRGVNGPNLHVDTRGATPDAESGMDAADKITSTLGNAAVRTGEATTDWLAKPR